MSLSEEVARMIRYRISEDPLARESLLAGGATPWTPVDAIASLNAYCNALSAALMRVTAEVDLIRGQATEPQS
jgi:hypothetical protein